MTPRHSLRSPARGVAPPIQSPTITPYCTLLEMASKLSQFRFRHRAAFGRLSQWGKGAAGEQQLAAIFTNIGASLGSVRLVPNGTS